LLKLLKTVDKQTYTLSIYIEKLDRCTKVFAKQKNRKRYSQTVDTTSEVITVEDLRVLYLQKLDKKLAKTDRKIKRKTNKITKEIASDVQAEQIIESTELTEIQSAALLTDAKTTCLRQIVYNIRMQVKTD